MNSINYTAIFTMISIEALSKSNLFTILSITFLAFPLATILISIKINGIRGIDGWRWLYWISELKNESKRTGDLFSRYIIKAPFSYPPIFFIVLSKFPEKWLRNNYLIIPWLFYFIEVILLIISLLLLKIPLNLIIFSVCIFFCMPSQLIENINFTTRSFGVMLFSIFLFSVIFNNYILQIFSVLIIMYGHRMTLQITIITSLALLTAGFPEQFLILCATFAPIYILNILGYRIIAKGHYRQLAHWYKNINEFPPSIKNKIQDLFRSFFPRALCSIILIIFITYSKPETITETQFKLLIFAYTPLFAGIIITYVTKLRNFGEGYRYIDFANMALILSLSTYNDNLWVFLVLIPLGIIPLYIKISQIIKDQSDYQFKFDEMQSVEFDELLKSADQEGIKFMSYPPSLDDYVAYRTKNISVFL